MSTIYNDKFKNLVLYILNSDDYKDTGIKKLNKILYFIDFYFYRDYEKSISNTSYAKAEMGPIVDQYKEIFNQMVQDRVLEKIDDDGKYLYKPLQQADIKQFSSEEINHIRNILEKYGRLSGAELESISHNQQPWVLTEKDGDKIDIDLALLIDDSDEEEYEVINEELRKKLEDLANSV